MTQIAPSFAETLYREHGAALLSYLRRRFGRGDAAEDLLQETFVQAVRTPARMEAATSPRAWLFAIARNVGLTAARRRRDTVPLASDVAVQSGPRPDPRVAEMREAITALPDTLREALELRLGAELSYDEIASVLNIPVGTVRSRLHQAVRQLRERMRPAEERRP